MGFSVNRRNSLRSPHVRGKAQRRLHQLHQLGITPACAGKRSTLLCAPPRSRDHPRACGEKRVRGKVHLRHNANLSPEDHPRVCGEKCSIGDLRLQGSGSPPRVRGKGVLIRFFVYALGITPACAGKRSKNEFKMFYKRDHPRVCGEKPHDAAGTSNREGSPPRVRGKEPGVDLLVNYHGITPACAGKSRMGA